MSNLTKICASVLLAPFAIVLLCWLAFLSFGGPIWATMDGLKQPYLALMWIAVGVTFGLIAALIIYDHLPSKGDAK